MNNLKSNYIQFINGLTKWFFVLLPTMIVSLFLGADLVDSYTTHQYITHEMTNRFPFCPLFVLYINLRSHLLSICHYQSLSENIHLKR